MSDNKKSKKVNYRRCKAEAPVDGNPSPSSFNLQSLLEKATKKLELPWQRKMGLDGKRVQLLAFTAHKQGCFCGTLVECEEDRLIPIVQVQNDGTTWQGSAEPKDKTGREGMFQETALYFAVRENHVAMIKTKELGVTDLADFFVWLIQTRAQLATTWAFFLVNLPRPTAIAKLKDHGVQKISIGNNVFETVKTALPAKPGAKRSRYAKELKVDPMIWRLLEQVIEDGEILSNLKKSSDPGNLHVGLEISYKSRSEKDAREVMSALAASVGDNPELSPKIMLNNDTEIKGDELTIRGDVEVQCPDGNVSADDAMTRVAEWLHGAISDHTVL